MQMDGGDVVFEFRALLGPDSKKGERTVLIVKKVVNNSSETVNEDKCSAFVSQSGAILELAAYPLDGTPEEAAPQRWGTPVRPGREMTIAQGYALSDSSQVAVEPYDKDNLKLHYERRYWQPE